MGLGERIKGRRLELKLTQDELARKARISKGFLSDLENGKRSIGAAPLLDIARALGKAMREFRSATDDIKQNFNMDPTEFTPRPNVKPAQPPKPDIKQEEVKEEEVKTPENNKTEDTDKT